MLTSPLQLDSSSRLSRSGSARYGDYEAPQMGTKLIDVCNVENIPRTALLSKVNQLLKEHGAPSLNNQGDVVVAMDAIAAQERLPNFCTTLLLALAEFFFPKTDHHQQHSSVILPQKGSISLERTGSQLADSLDMAGAFQVPADDSTAKRNNSTASGSSVVASTQSVSSASSPAAAMLHTNHVEKRVDDEGNTLINRYTVVDNLGRGAYGKVKLAVDEDNCPVAIKIVRKSLLKKLGGQHAIDREVAVLKKLKHRNVVPLYEVIDDPESEKLYLVMKYVDGGPIAKVQPNNTCDAIAAERAKEVMRELVSGLSYLHKRGVAHRDIKPDNILLDREGTPYFSDFGVSTIIDKDNPKVNTVEGTPLFMPPELFNSETLNVDPFAADVWSLGVTMFLLLFGEAPFRGTNHFEISESVLHDEPLFPLQSCHGETIDEGWQALLQGMLRKDPSKRLTLKQIKKHPTLLEEPGVTEEEICRAMRIMPNPVNVSEKTLVSQAPRASFFCFSKLELSLDPESRVIPKTPTVVPVCARRSMRPSAAALFSSVTLSPLELSAAAASGRAERNAAAGGGLSAVRAQVPDRLSLDCTGGGGVPNRSENPFPRSSVGLDQTNLNVLDCSEPSQTAIPSRPSLAPSPPRGENKGAYGHHLHVSS
jgi:serine/threonine protein kinase